VLDAERRTGSTRGTRRLGPIRSKKAVKESHVQAVVGLARTLRDRGLVAAESAETVGVARVLVDQPVERPLAEQVDVVVQNGMLWFAWSGEPLCPADDIDTAAQKIAHLLTPGAIWA
jgi:hypothetical protein